MPQFIADSQTIVPRSTYSDPQGTLIVQLK